jgi:hypothetical protein
MGLGHKIHKATPPYTGNKNKHLRIIHKNIPRINNISNKTQKYNKNTPHGPTNHKTYAIIPPYKNIYKETNTSSKDHIKNIKKYNNPLYQYNNTHESPKPSKKTNNQKNIINRNNNTDIPNYVKTHTLNLLLLCGDIETNPGPMPDILKTHPPSHKRRNKIYFIPFTIKLHPEYQHLAKQFAACIKITHPNHTTASIEYPHLSKYIQEKQQHPPQRILYALITTISPVLETCDHQLIHIPNPDWTTTLLDKMTLLQNPPERHILKPHPYTEFINTNQILIRPPNTIHKQLYDFIKQNNNPPNLQLLTNKFPFLPENLLLESLKCNEPITEYSHPPPLSNIPLPQNQIIQTTNNNTYIITWNASSLNTALPNIHNLITSNTANPAIITIQEKPNQPQQSQQNIYKTYSQNIN